MRGRFLVPEDRVQKHLSVICKILTEGRLEKVTGRCISMAVAVPCAALFTRAQYQALLPLQRGRDKRRYTRGIQGNRPLSTEAIPVRGELKEELSMWLNLDSYLINGTAWPSCSRVFRLEVEGATDASPRRWGGRSRIATTTQTSWFTAAGDFSAAEASQQIAEKEAIALERVFKGFLEQQPRDRMDGARFSFKCDSRCVVDIYNRGGSTKQMVVTRICKRLFLLQLSYRCSLRLEWIPTSENEADALTREDARNGSPQQPSCTYAQYYHTPVT
ncbi:unnamed protein product [Heterosigma akashiwo]